MKIDEFAPGEILKAIFELNGKETRVARGSAQGKEPMRSKPGIIALRALYQAPEYQLSRSELEKRIAPADLNQHFGFFCSSVLRLLGVREVEIEPFALAETVHGGMDLKLRPSVVAAIELAKPGSIKASYLWPDWAFKD